MALILLGMANIYLLGTQTPTIAPPKITNYTVQVQFDCYFDNPNILLYLEDDKGREVYSYKSDSIETRYNTNVGLINDTYFEQTDQIRVTAYIIHSCVRRYRFICFRYSEQIVRRNSHALFIYRINLTEKGLQSFCPKNVADLKKRSQFFEYPPSD